jgi:hypothetical protein
MNLIFDFTAGDTVPSPGGDAHYKKSASIRMSDHNFMASKVTELARVRAAC